MRQLHSTALIIFKWDNSKLHEQHAKIAKLLLPLIFVLVYFTPEYTSEIYPDHDATSYWHNYLAFLLLELREKFLS